MKELKKLRHEVLNLRNIKEISKNAEAKLLHKLNALQESINDTRCCETLAYTKDSKEQVSIPKVCKSKTQIID